MAKSKIVFSDKLQEQIRQVNGLNVFFETLITSLVSQGYKEPEYQLADVGMKIFWNEPWVCFQADDEDMYFGTADGKTVKEQSKLNIFELVTRLKPMLEQHKDTTWIDSEYLIGSVHSRYLVIVDFIKQAKPGDSINSLLNLEDMKNSVMRLAQQDCYHLDTLIKIDEDALPCVGRGANTLRAITNGLRKKFNKGG